MGLTFLVIMGVIVIVAAVLLPGLDHRSRKFACLATCQNNLKQLGLIFTMYSSESRENIYPSMQLKDCNDKTLAWSKTPDMASLMPEYLSDALAIII